MKNQSALKIAYLLLTSDRPLSTTEIVDRIGCDRKTVYFAIDQMEICGFVTEVIESGHKRPNRYLCKLRLEDIAE